MYGNSKNGDDFWDLEKHIKKSSDQRLTPAKVYSHGSTEATDINIDTTADPSSVQTRPSRSPAFTDIKLTKETQKIEGSNEITRFIPPHTDPKFAKKYVLSEYTPKNPLIKSVRIYSEKPDDKIFIESNLFMRERNALINRTSAECYHVPFYSYSPRYSQLSNAQLKWYLWWRENTRHGIFLKTDEAYIILYAYELASTGDDEDKQSSLDMLCSLLCNYTDKDLNIIFRMLIRDLICDFCLLHGLDSPIEKLKGLDRQLLANSTLPEFFIDLSENIRLHSIDFAAKAVSLYDYRRSKCYNENTAELFHKSIKGALHAVVNHQKAFDAITSFTDGMYGCVTAERRPFGRMVNIVNKNIKFEITYFQLSNIQAAITDAIRYSENRLREHLGIKNKLHILSVNPWVKEAVDNYFDQNYPPMPIIDRRKKANKPQEENEYDKLYDLPKVEISPERAIEIERESWSTTKILTEAFADSDDLSVTDGADNSDVVEELPVITIEDNTHNYDLDQQGQALPQAPDIFTQLKEKLGKAAEFIELCKTDTLYEQRKFALSSRFGTEELADKINEAAVDIFGDIIIENDGDAYRIIEDYKDLF